MSKFCFHSLLYHDIASLRCGFRNPRLTQPNSLLVRRGDRAGPALHSRWQQWRLLLEQFSEGHPVPKLPEPSELPVSRWDWTIWLQQHQGPCSGMWHWTLLLIRFPWALALLPSQILWTMQNPNNKSHFSPKLVRRGLGCLSSRTHTNPLVEHVPPECSCSHLGRWLMALTAFWLVSTVGTLFYILVSMKAIHQSCLGPHSARSLIIIN